MQGILLRKIPMLKGDCNVACNETRESSHLPIESGAVTDANVSTSEPVIKPCAACGSTRYLPHLRSSSRTPHRIRAHTFDAKLGGKDEVLSDLIAIHYLAVA